MTEITDYWKPKVEGLNDKLWLKSTEVNQLLSFIEALECASNDWDKCCDCVQTNGIHEDECMTIKIRNDLEKLNGNQNK